MLQTLWNQQSIREPWNRKARIKNLITKLAATNKIWISAYFIDHKKKKITIQYIAVKHTLAGWSCMNTKSTNDLGKLPI